MLAIYYGLQYYSLTYTASLLNLRIYHGQIIAIRIQECLDR